jgi:hypothetical protein
MLVNKTEQQKPANTEDPIAAGMSVPYKEQRCHGRLHVPAEKIRHFDRSPPGLPDKTPFTRKTGNPIPSDDAIFV